MKISSPIMIFYIHNCTAQNSSISCIVKDKTGFIWFGTWNGLNRYDGYEFKIEEGNLLIHFVEG